MEFKSCPSAGEPASGFAFSCVEKGLNRMCVWAVASPACHAWNRAGTARALGEACGMAGRCRQEVSSLATGRAQAEAQAPAPVGKRADCDSASEQSGLRRERTGGQKQEAAVSVPGRAVRGIVSAAGVPSPHAPA